MPIQQGIRVLEMMIVIVIVIAVTTIIATHVVIILIAPVPAIPCPNGAQGCAKRV